MRLVFTSDLHVEYHMDVVGLVAEQAARLQPEVLVLGGDVCPDLSRLEAALRVIAGAFDGALLFLPGNHELWCGGSYGGGPDSRERYHTVIPALTRRAGAVPLGVEPFVLHGVGFVGVTGWYDYSFRDPSLVGVAADSEYAAKQFGDVACVDGQQVYWPGTDGVALGDEALCVAMCELLADQLDRVAARVDRIVVVTHMLAHRAVLDRCDRSPDRGADERFLDAFMGSSRLGDLLADRAGVVRILSGHVHQPVQVSVAGRGGSIPCDLSPVGYPRELQGSLEEHVFRRLLVLEV